VAVQHETTLFDVCDFKVFEMLNDVPGASAGPSYGPAIDVPGVAAFSGFDPNIVSAELKGDCRVLARQGRIDSMRASFTYGKLALDVLDAIYTGEIFDAAGYAAFRMLAGAETKYFKAEVVITGVDVGLTDARVILYKAQITGGTFFDQTTDNFGQPKFDVDGIGIDSGDEGADYPAAAKTLMADVVING
jgi:hypothetical protein